MAFFVDPVDGIFERVVRNIRPPERLHRRRSSVASADAKDQLRRRHFHGGIAIFTRQPFYGLYVGFGMCVTDQSSAAQSCPPALNRVFARCDWRWRKASSPQKPRLFWCVALYADRGTAIPSILTVERRADINFINDIRFRNRADSSP